MSFLVCSRPLGAFDVVPVHSVITVESGPCRACDRAVHISGRVVGSLLNRTRLRAEAKGKISFSGNRGFLKFGLDQDPIL